MFKKILTVMAMTLMLAGVSFAQDNQNNQGNQNSQSASTSKMGNSDGLIGISLDLNTMSEWDVVFNVSQNLSIVGILGFNYYNDDHDDDLNITIGVGAIFLLTKQLLPISLEGDIKLSTEDWIGLDIMMDLALPVLPHFNLVGKAGIDVSIGTEDPDPMQITPITKISAVWFFI